MPKETVKISGPATTRFIAHRGLSGCYTENSVGAFEAAGEKNYFGIETDIRRTTDGVFVTLHDASTRRVSDSNITVSQSDYRTVSEVSLKNTSGTPSERRIPTLEEYISICRKHGKAAVIELKGRFRHREIGELCRETDRLGYTENCIFISFEFENLFLLRLYRPSVAAQYLVKKVTFGLLFRLRLHRIDLDIKHTAVTRELIEKCHAAGIKVNCWTVNKVSAARRLADMGVDFITTNILEPENDKNI